MAYADVVIDVYATRVGCEGTDEGISRERHLVLIPKTVQGDPVNGVFIWFLENHPPETGVGYYNPENGWLLARAHISDFDNMYHVVQTEKSAMFRFAARDDTNDILWFQVSTGAELPGEGTAKTAQEVLSRLNLLRPAKSI